ncbi:hypothetical protein U1Q18_027187, partial [Sarracenia purpurea var. burkii]
RHRFRLSSSSSSSSFSSAQRRHRSVEVGQFLDSNRFCVEVRRLDLAADLFQRFEDESRLTDDLKAEALNQVIDSALEQGVHDRWTCHY